MIQNPNLESNTHHTPPAEQPGDRGSLGSLRGERKVSNPALTPALLRTGRLVARLLRSGIPMGPLRILETTGRISGRPRFTPVVMTTHKGDRWLVSPFGDTDWVRNVRKQPGVHLVRLRRRERVYLTEVDHDTAAPVLQTFLRRFRMVPFVPPAFDASVSSDLTAVRAEAHRHPVFRVSRAV